MSHKPRPPSLAPLRALTSALGLNLDDDQVGVLTAAATADRRLVKVVTHLVRGAFRAGGAARVMDVTDVLAYLASQGRPIAVKTWSAYVARHEAPAPIRPRSGLWWRREITAWARKPDHHSTNTATTRAQSRSAS